MSADLTPFDFDGQTVRVALSPDGSPLFVLADVCAALGIANHRNVAARLDIDDVQSTDVIDSLGRTQHMHAVTESGVIDVTLDSRKPEARRFRRWLTHDVVPQIMKTGTYTASPALTEDEIVHEALRITDRKVRELTAEVVQLTPRAEAWDVMVDASGDYAVDEAAKVLSRDPNITIGRTRLFTLMGELGWIFRQGKRGRWHAYQTAIETGRLTERLSGAFLNTRTQEMEAAAPTIRITTKGLDALRERLTRQEAS